MEIDICGDTKAQSVYDSDWDNPRDKFLLWRYFGLWNRCNKTSYPQEYWRLMLIHKRSILAWHPADGESRRITMFGKTRTTAIMVTRDLYGSIALFLVVRLHTRLGSICTRMIGVTWAEDNASHWLKHYWLFTINDEKVHVLDWSSCGAGNGTDFLWALIWHDVAIMPHVVKSVITDVTCMWLNRKWKPMVVPRHQAFMNIFRSIS